MSLYLSNLGFYLLLKSQRNWQPRGHAFPAWLLRPLQGTPGLGQGRLPTTGRWPPAGSGQRGSAATSSGQGWKGRSKSQLPAGPSEGCRTGPGPPEHSRARASLTREKQPLQPPQQRRAPLQLLPEALGHAPVHVAGLQQLLKRPDHGAHVLATGAADAAAVLHLLSLKGEFPGLGLN